MTHRHLALRVAARTSTEPEPEQAFTNVDIEIDDARRRLLRAEANGIEEVLDDVLGRMRDTLDEFEEQRSLVTGLLARLVALRDAECGVDRILRMRLTGE